MQLTADDVSTSHPVVWPAGTELTSTDPLVIWTPDGEVREGDRVSGGAGYLNAGGLSTLTISVPAECLPEYNDVAVFNPTSAVKIQPR